MYIFKVAETSTVVNDIPEYSFNIENIKGIKLNINDIVFLISLIQNGHQEDSFYGFRVESKIKKTEIQVDLRNKNIEEELKKIFENYDHKSIYLNYYNKDISLSLKLNQHFAYLNLSGKNKIEINGKFKQIYDFLKARMQWYWVFINYPYLITCLLAYLLFLFINTINPVKTLYNIPLFRLITYNFLYFGSIITITSILSTLLTRFFPVFQLEHNDKKENLLFDIIKKHLPDTIKITIGAIIGALATVFFTNILK